MVPGVLDALVVLVDQQVPEVLVVLVIPIVPEVLKDLVVHNLCILALQGILMGMYKNPLVCLIFV